ncbi:hypothetical protein HZ994_07105 [Akkermansiaceae bacterium]|nr:hypothetical protein HZ994_07105 [Akkermansiaceae bacterium]
MDFISEYFYVIILIVGAIAQWLKSRSEAKDEGGYHPDELEEFEMEAERRIPRPAVPPPLPPSGAAVPDAVRPAVPDLRRQSPPPLLEAFDPSAELSRQQALMERAREFKKAKSARTTKAPKQAGERAVSTAPAGSIRNRLHKRSELRSAFVLKEILEKPVGLR